jgi:hypothetical protein
MRALRLLLRIAAATAASLAAACSRCGDDADGAIATFFEQQAENCSANGNLITLEFSEPTTEAAVRALIEPVGGTIACTNLKLTECYIVRVPEDGCCEALHYLVNSDPPAVIMGAQARSGCSCRVSWPN